VVAVAHPDIQLRLAAVVAQALEQCIRVDHVHFGVAELALVSRFGGTAQLRGHGLHAVADAQIGRPLSNTSCGAAGAPGSVVDSGPPEDDALGAERRDLAG
jgi:hypothetical protein